MTVPRPTPAAPPRPVYGALDEVLDSIAAGRPWRRVPMDKHEDSLSGSTFEYAVVGASDEPDERYVIKHINRDLDWIMRVLGDGADGMRPRALIMWSQGLLDALPPEIDPVIVGMAYDPGSGHLLQVMRDVRTTLVPPGTSVVGLRRHRRFLVHMAAMHAAFWEFEERYGLTTVRQRYGFAHPSHTERERAAGHHDAVPAMFPAGWAAVGEMVPRAAEVGLALAADPEPLQRAMATGPQTLVHGDWKYGNLGSHPDGRTVLLDWAWPGRAGPCVDLAWYLAVNCDRLPESKEETIAAYRDALERRGIGTAAWWARHLELALLGAFVQLGWSKAGNPAELHWWTTRTLPTARSLCP
jgi:hypothetical protein